MLTTIFVVIAAAVLLAAVSHGLWVLAYAKSPRSVIDQRLNNL